jgi:hypothetical protein
MAMRTLKEYYDNDFNHCVKVHMRLEMDGLFVYGAICYDFTAFTAFTSFYVSEENLDRSFFEELLRKLKYGETQFQFDNEVTFPSPKDFPGEFETEGPFNFSLKAKFYGDMDWMDKDEIQSSRRIFIYSESNLPDNEIKDLKQFAGTLTHNLHFRSKKFMMERGEKERTLPTIDDSNL